MTASAPQLEMELMAQAREIFESFRRGATHAPRAGIHKLVDEHGAVAVHVLRAQANAGVYHESAWRLARQIYSELAPRDRFCRRMLRRANWVCRHGGAFDRLFDAHRHERRLLQRAATTFPEAVRAEREVGPGGLNTTASYKHRLLDPRGDTCAIIFEKVYIGRSPAGFRRVRALHAQAGSVPAFAPAYRGAMRAGPFMSTLHDSVDGSPPPPDAWPGVLEGLLEELWRHTHRPCDRTRPAARANFQNMIAQVTGVGKVTGTAWRWPPRGLGDLPALLAGRQDRSRLSALLDSDQLDRLGAALKPIKRRLAAQPQFIMHGDLHRTQAHYDTRHGRYLLIDWDRWSLEPLGAGWPLGTDGLTGVETSTGADGPAIPPRLSELADRHSIAPEDAMLAATMWALRQASISGDTRQAQHYTGWALQLVGR